MKRKIGIIIQARLGSTRLSRKIDLNFHKDQTILDILIEKLLKYKNKYPIVLSTGDAIDNLELEKYAQKYPIEFFVGSENNVLDRFIKTAEQYDLTHILRVCSDNPFLDLHFIDQLLNEYENSNADYISFKSHEGIPVIRTHFGLFTEIVSLKALKNQQRLEDDLSIIEHVTMYIYENPMKFNIDLLDLPAFLHRKDLRFTVDDQDDFTNLKWLYSSCKHLPTQKLIEFIDKTPEMKEKMKINIKKYSK